MKLGILAASTLIGVAAVMPASFAQGDGHVMLEMSRTPQAGESGASRGRTTVPGPAPTLHGVRPAAGMLPPPAGPVRGFTATASSVPIDGGDIRPRLRAD